MESITYKSKISESFENVRRLSFEEKKEAALDETKINQFLDKILEFKTIFTIKTLRINALVEKIEELTWINEVDNESLMLINDLISSIRDLHATLQKQYVSINFIRNKGIAKEAIKQFQTAIGDLKEIAADLESRFFFLPENADFQEITKELSLL